MYVQVFNPLSSLNESGYSEFFGLTLLNGLYSRPLHSVRHQSSVTVVAVLGVVKTFQTKVSVPRQVAFRINESIDRGLHDHRPSVLLPRSPEISLDFGPRIRQQIGVRKDLAGVENESRALPTVASTVGSHNVDLVVEWAEYGDLAVLENCCGVTEDEVDCAFDDAGSVELTV